SSCARGTRILHPKPAGGKAAGLTFRRGSWDHRSMPGGASSTSLRDDAVAIIRHLQKHGHEAVFAGGCVRDLLLRRHPADYDIATSARPEQVEALFDRTIPIGRQFGIVLVASGEHHYEVATFRKDAAYV